MTIAMNERLKEFVRRLDQVLEIVERARIRALTADYRELPGYPEGWADRIDWTGYPESLQEDYRNLIEGLVGRRQTALKGGFPELGPRGNERGRGLGLSKGAGEWCHDRSVMDALYSLEAFFQEKPLPPLGASSADEDKAVQVDRALSRAFRTDSQDDYLELFAVLPGSDVFFPYAVQGQDRVVPILTIENNKRALTLFTSPDDPNLIGTFGEMRWEDFLGMIMKMPELDGVIIMNKRKEWVGIDRRTLDGLYPGFSMSFR